MRPNNNFRIMHGKTQSGNVFVIILIAIFLFSALMYLFSKSFNQGTGNLNKQQVKIAAQEIISYANLIEGAVDRIRRNGCSENEISFDNAIVSGYSNPTAPIDNHCNVFDENGGKIKYEAVSQSYIDSSFETAWNGDADRDWGDYIFSGECSFPGIGTDCGTSDCKELSLDFHFVKKEICLEINKQLGIDLVSDDAPIENISTPPGEMTCQKYTGTYSNSANGVDDGVNGAASACLKVNDGSNDYYYFYRVLLAR